MAGFLRSTGSRKFDLRSCGPPQATPRRHSRRIAAPNYVPQAHRRHDEMRYQVRQQMRVPDY
ncbi:unnamed protein product [Effrenium voratum]|nr:unnamed protein product [Effrenium voratum]